MHKQAINHKQAIIGGGLLFTDNACFLWNLTLSLISEKYSLTMLRILENGYNGCRGQIAQFCGDELFFSYWML